MRTGLVIGGTGGIGSAVVDVLLARDFRVGIASRRAGQAAVADPRRWHCDTDLTDPKAVADLAGRVGQEAPAGLDALVLSAGSAVLGDLGATTPEEVEEMLRVHVVGPYRAVRTLLPALIAAQGCVVLVASAAATRPRRDRHAYGTAKAALVYLAQCLSQDLARSGVRVYEVSPGATATPLLDRLAGGRAPVGALHPGQVATTIADLITDTGPPRGAPFPSMAERSR